MTDTLPIYPMHTTVCSQFSQKSTTKVWIIIIRQQRTIVILIISRNRRQLFSRRWWCTFSLPFCVLVSCEKLIFLGQNGPISIMLEPFNHHFQLSYIPLVSTWVCFPYLLSFFQQHIMLTMHFPCLFFIFFAASAFCALKLFTTSIPSANFPTIAWCPAV